MMIRSSSTPVLGSLLPSISPENPNNHNNEVTFHAYKSSPIHKFSFHQTPSPGSQHFTTLSCNSSPISPSFGTGGIRRVQSEGNLESLMSCDDDFSFVNPPRKLSSRLHGSLLETIPSLSYHNSRFKSDGDESSDDEQQEQEDEEREEEGEGFCEFGGFSIENKVLRLNKELEFGDLGMENDVGEGGSRMYLAKGIGVDAGFGCPGDGAAGSGGGGRNLSYAAGEDGGGGGDDDGGNYDVEEHYRKMVTKCPGNPLFLRNYAQFLHQSKQDLEGAEEYYSRAILADPNDGEILSQYAKLVWELHHDSERATTYFERAIQASSEDSHIHAAYASFLWETEGEEEEEGGYYGDITPLFKNGKMASAATA